MSWLDDLYAQMTASADSGGSAADAVPSEPATDAALNPAKDSQLASSLFADTAAADKSNPLTEFPSWLQAMGNAGEPQGQSADARNGADVMSDQFDARSQNPSSAGGFSAAAQSLSKASVKRTSDGSIDWLDPNNIQLFTKMIAGASPIINALMNKGQGQGYKTAQQLQDEIKSLQSSWNPQQQAWANATFSHQPVPAAQRARLYAADMPSPIVPGKGYADGGSVSINPGVDPSQLAQANNLPSNQTYSFMNPTSNPNLDFSSAGSYYGMPLQSNTTMPYGALNKLDTGGAQGYMPSGYSAIDPSLGARFTLQSGVAHSNDPNLNDMLVDPSGQWIAQWGGGSDINGQPLNLSKGYSWSNGKIVADPNSTGWTTNPGGALAALTPSKPGVGPAGAQAWHRAHAPGGPVAARGAAPAAASGWPSAATQGLPVVSAPNSAMVNFSSASPSSAAYGPLHMSRGGAVPGYARGGALGHVMASTGGQDDVVPARLAGGEYVMDADTVAAAGDGNNAAGAAQFDKLRRNIRKHKRSAPPDKIPPKAKPLEQYMTEGK